MGAVRFLGRIVVAVVLLGRFLLASNLPRILGLTSYLLLRPETVLRLWRRGRLWSSELAAGNSGCDENLCEIRRKERKLAARGWELRVSLSIQTGKTRVFWSLLAKNRPGPGIRPKRAGSAWNTLVRVPPACENRGLLFHAWHLTGKGLPCFVAILAARIDRGAFVVVRIIPRV